MYCGTAVISSATTIPVTLTAGYYDDFTFNYNWTVSGASANTWEVGVPVETLDGATPANPGADDTTDCSDKAYITDNGGGGPWDNDVDLGATILTSPAMNLTTYIDPYIHYTRWFYDGGLINGAPNDSMKVQITNGTTTATVETMVPGSPGNGTWVQKMFRVADYVTPTANTKIIFYTTDVTWGNIVEGGVDKLYVTDTIAVGMNEFVNDVVLNVFPNPFTGTSQIDYHLTSGLSSDAELLITDVAGRKVLSLPVKSQSGKVTVGKNLSSGIYFARITNGNEISKVLKLVKLN